MGLKPHLCPKHSLTSPFSIGIWELFLFFYLVLTSQIKIFYWNVRGIGNDLSKSMLVQHCHINHPDLVCIAKPMVVLSIVIASFWRSLDLVILAKNVKPLGLPIIWVFYSIRVATPSMNFVSN